MSKKIGIGIELHGKLCSYFCRKYNTPPSLKTSTIAEKIRNLFPNKYDNLGDVETCRAFYNDELVKIDNSIKESQEKKEKENIQQSSFDRKILVTRGLVKPENTEEEKLYIEWNSQYPIILKDWLIRG